MRRTFAALAVAAAVALLLPAAAPASVRAADGYRQTAATVYRLDPANGRLRVTVTIKVTNRTPDRVDTYPCMGNTGGWLPIPYPTTCERRTRYYMTTTSALVENEATAIRATSGGRTLATAAGTPGAAYRPVTVTFPELYSGDTRTVKLSYTLRGGEPRSATATRTLRAFASFCAIANGEDTGTVTVRVPKGFRLDVTGEKMRSKVAGKERVLTSGRIAEPQRWFACFAGPNAGGYRTESVKAHDGRTIQLRSWPEDPAWASGVRADVESSLPLLERLAGTTIEGDARLSVQESVAGSGYAGFFDPRSGTITVGEDFGQPALVEHELAHAWFNGSTFADAWLVEGMAEWAGRAVSGEAAACERPAVPDGTLDLDDWRYLGPGSTAEEHADVALRYAAACYVVTAVAETAGEEGMTAAVTSLLRRVDPYAAGAGAAEAGAAEAGAAEAGAGAVRRANRIATWKDWLDAVDELALAPAGADPSLASGLLVAFGVAEDGALLDDRAAARQAWGDLLATTEGWVVPPAVRAPMAAWRFREATAAIALARRTWDLTGATDAVLAGVDARHGPAAEAWARAGTLVDLQAAAVLAERQLAAARDVAEATALLDAPLDVAQWVGLFGTSIPSLDTAIPSVRAGDSDSVAAITAGVRATVAGLRAAGQQRMVAGAITALALLAVGSVLLARRRRTLAARRMEAERSASVVATAVAHPGPASWDAAFGAVPPIDDATQVWQLPLVASDPEPDLGALVRTPPRPPTPPPAAPGDPRPPAVD